ncbi:MAG: GAF domain-containing protein [Deltaproteobacteria bacterium]|nr:GAF domain-containing protein [Deltaproteobacteria bacterium]
MSERDFDFEQVYGALPVAVALLADGRVVRTNPAMAELFRCAPEKLQGRSIWEFVSGGGNLERLQDRYAARLRGETVTPVYEMELQRDDGTALRVESTARALDEQRTIVVFRELPTGRGVPLVTTLAEAGVQLQRATTPEGVAQAAVALLAGLGLRAYISEVRDGTLNLIAATPGDEITALTHRLRPGYVNRPMGRRLDQLNQIFALARFMDDYPAVIREHLLTLGLDPALFAELLAMPVYARGVMTPLRVEGALWGTLTVTGADLQAHDTSALALFAAQVAAALEVARSFQSLQQTNRQLAAVHAMAAAGAEAELDRLLPKLLDTASESTASPCSMLWVLDGEELVLAGARGLADQPLGTRRPAPGSLTGKVLGEGRARAFALDRVTAETGFVVPPSKLKHLAILPLWHQGKAMGTLNLGREVDQPFTAADLAGAELIAAQLVVQLIKGRLIEAERRRVHDLQLLLDVGRLITASLDPDELLESAAANVARLVDASDAFIWLYDPATRELIGAATSTPDFREHFREVRMQINGPNTAAGRAILARAPVRILDAASSTIINTDLNLTYQVKSLLALPMLVRDQPIGAVTIGDRYRNREWTESEVERATVVVNQMAVAVANARLFDDLKRSYDKLAQAREELVKRERLAALGELSAVVAHEVRNPLGVVFNSLGSLRKAVRGNTDAEMLIGIVGEEADRLNRIVSDLLDFARPHEASLRLEPLEAVLESAREATLALTGGAHEIALELSPALPRVAADARMLRQAFINLLVNAVQASPRGGQVTMRAQSRAGKLRVEVADHGPGIPAAHRSRIFQPFFTTKATGTGLGLAVVKRIVEAHRGEVTLESTEGQGTTFSVSLPVPADDRATQPAI